MKFPVDLTKYFNSVVLYLQDLGLSCYLYALKEKLHKFNIKVQNYIYIYLLLTYHRCPMLVI